jgi:TraM recognition site of TraD and TraG
MSPMGAMTSARRRLLGSVAIPALVVGILAALPKSPTYVADDRLLMTVVACAVVPSGIVSFLLWRRRYREALLRLRYRKATRAMRETLQFWSNEVHNSRQFRLQIIIGLLISLDLLLLAQWPQFGVIRPLHNVIAGTAAISFALLFVQLIYVRRSLENAAFLKAYLRDQAEYIGFTPGENSVGDGATEPPVTMTGPLSFRTGGFEWKFGQDLVNVLVLGQPGSGKTVALMNNFLSALIACGSGDQKTAGLILDPKGAYRDIIGPLCQELGRGDDLYVLNPDGWAEHARTAASIAWNPLDTRDDALEVAARTITVMKLVGGLESRESFFIDSARSFLRHALVLFRAARAPDPPSLLDLHRLCAEPQNAPVIYDSLIDKLTRKYPDAPPPEVAAAFLYFEQEFRTLPERQLAALRSQVSHLIDDLSAEPFNEIISGRSTISIPNVIDQGKLLYVHLPLADRERVSKLLTTAVKLEWQREILRRVRKSWPSFLLADEYQSIFISGKEYSDGSFFERSRESFHLNCIAAQNLGSFFKQTQNKSDVTNFMGLCAVKIFLRNTERETLEWASNLFGERHEIIVTASEAADLNGGFSRHRTNYSRSFKAMRVVPVEAFTTLGVPVEIDPDRQFTESIVHLGSRAATAKLELSWRVNPLRP